MVTVNQSNMWLDADVGFWVASAREEEGDGSRVRVRKEQFGPLPVMPFMAQALMQLLHQK